MNETPPIAIPAKISIITPSYQQGEFIDATIQSVILQNYPDLEYILIDGGSTDNTLDIIRNHEQKITRWISEPDTGQADALNKGFHLATGEIIGWINSDDLLMPGALEKVAAFFATHPEISFVYGDALAIDREGNPLFFRRPGPFDIRWLIRTDDIPQSSVFFRRELLASVGYLDDRLHYALDYDLLIRSALKQDPAYLPECLSAFRIYPGTKTAAGKIQFSVEIVHFIDKILRSTHLPDDLKLRFLTTLFWRVCEIILERGPGNLELTDLRNDSSAIQVARSYCDLLYPHFLQLLNIPAFGRSRLDAILSGAFSEVLDQYPGKLALSDTPIEEFVRMQDLDVVIFSYRAWKANQRTAAFRLFGSVCFRIPFLIFDQQFRKILKIQIH
jgi:glycosyltransferase involved in cell wall biosynthesis